MGTTIPGWPEPPTLKRPREPARRALARQAGRVICVGAGGVGKTTTSAALALGLARAGRRWRSCTIDPAKRLASALGLEELLGRAARIEPAMLAAQGVAVEGELWAMMLDAKRTFDEIIARLAPDERAREEILANPVYRELSTAVAGSHELSAIAKLYELYEEHDFDVIVLDTPPSRNALDFLNAPDAPARLPGRPRAAGVPRPGRADARACSGGAPALVFAIFARVTGVDMLGELSTFFRSLSGVIDGFGERTRGVAELLRAPETTFLIVTSPEPEPAREAVFLADELAAAGMAGGELIVNRVHSDGLAGRSVNEVSELLAPALGDQLAARVAGNLGRLRRARAARPRDGRRACRARCRRAARCSCPT